MGIIISIPQLGGPLSVLPQTSTSYPTSPLPTFVYPTKSVAFGVSSAGLHQSSRSWHHHLQSDCLRNPQGIKNTLATISATQAGKSQPAGVTTDLISVHDPAFSVCTDITTTLFSTATVTSTTTSSHLIIATAVVASNCSVGVNASSIKTQSAKSNTLSTMRAATNSSPAVASSKSGFSTISSHTSSYSGPSKAMPSQRPLATKTTQLGKEVSSIMLRGVQAYNLSSLIHNVSGVVSNHSSQESRKFPVPTVSIDMTKSLVGGHNTAQSRSDYVSSSNDPSIRTTHDRTVTVKGTPQTSYASTSISGRL